MTANPMPGLIIKKVGQFGKANTSPDFLDRNGVLFEWDNEVYKYPQGIIEEDVVLYPALAAEILGMVLDQDQPIPLIKDKIEPQGPAKDKDAAAQNVNIKYF